MKKQILLVITALLLLTGICAVGQTVEGVTLDREMFQNFALKNAETNAAQNDIPATLRQCVRILDRTEPSGTVTVQRINQAKATLRAMLQENTRVSAETRTPADVKRSVLSKRLNELKNDLDAMKTRHAAFLEALDAVEEVDSGSTDNKDRLEVAIADIIAKITEKETAISGNEADAATLPPE